MVDFTKDLHFPGQTWQEIPGVSGKSIVVQPKGGRIVLWLGTDKPSDGDTDGALVMPGERPLVQVDSKAWAFGLSSKVRLHVSEVT